MWAFPLLFQHYGGVEGWLLNLGSFSITMSFGLILHTAGTVSSCVCVCGGISYLVPHQRTLCVLVLLSYFILLSAGKSVNAL